MNETLQKEREFHDAWANSINVNQIDPKAQFESSLSLECKWLLEEMGDLKGKKVLELGSGAGEGAVYFAIQGAQVTATDLSEGMLKVVDQLARRFRVSVKTVASSADDLSQFDDNSFDIVYAANLLHHVDIMSTLTEVKRVLKSGGLACFWDPLAYNPVINVYRSMATEVRTPDEHPITISDVRDMNRLFDTTRFHHSWLTGLLVFLKLYLIDKINPNEQRYWKIIHDREDVLGPFVKYTNHIDQFLLKICPPLKWWAWNISCVLRKG
jgi:ubiquinone/menaquinone biosynthesis C-methylase UbiE